MLGIKYFYFIMSRIGRKSTRAVGSSGASAVLDGSSVCGHDCNSLQSCGKCKVNFRLNSPSLECDRCKNWFCLKCLQWDKKDYDHFNSNQKVLKSLFYLSGLQNSSFP